MATQAEQQHDNNDGYPRGGGGAGDTLESRQGYEGEQSVPHPPPTGAGRHSDPRGRSMPVHRPFGLTAVGHVLTRSTIMVG